MTLEDILQHTDFRLPLENSTGKQFKVFLDEKLQSYIEKLKGNPDLLNGMATQISGKDEMIKRAEEVSKRIIKIFDLYHSNNRDDATREFERLMRYLTYFLFSPNNCAKSVNGTNSFYRCKYYTKDSTNTVKSKKDLFHADFLYRDKIPPTRFSPTGFASLYLANSLIVGFLECRAKDMDNFQSAKFSPKLPLLFLDLDYNLPFDLQKTDKARYDEILQYKMILYPLYLACFCIYERSDPAPPEYIIPQLLISWVKDSAFQGIKYPSTKTQIKQDTGQFYNLVLPPKVIDDEGVCVWLRDEALIMSDVCSWPHHEKLISNYYNAKYPKNSPINPSIEMIEWPKGSGSSSHYDITDIGKMEYYIRDNMQVNDISF